MSSSYALEQGALFVDAAYLYGEGTKFPIDAQVNRMNNPLRHHLSHRSAPMVDPYQPISGTEPKPAVSLEPHHEFIICSSPQ
jgi:hypothetical protein